MKNTRHLLILCALITIGLESCSDAKMEEYLKPVVVAPPSSIERDVVGHEQIFSIQAILRYALPTKKGDYYLAYDLTQQETPFPIYQEIHLDKDENGSLSISSNRKCFDVIKGKDISYALELKYFDINGKLINYQFSKYDKALEGKEGSEHANTLSVHQTFFTIQNYSLDTKPVAYPMTLDSVYYDKYLYQIDRDGNRRPASMASPYVVYAPDGEYRPNTLKYDYALAMRATENAISDKATLPYTDPKTQQVHRLYRALGLPELAEHTQEIFSYQYRDTDPVQMELGSLIIGIDDLGRQRIGQPVTFLRKKRELQPGAPRDALGFKGLLRFKQSNIAFQMRVCIAHVLTREGKYDLWSQPGGVHHHYQISNMWNTFDIDYPLPFRVIADLDEDRSKFVEDIKRYYPKATRTEIDKMIDKKNDYFYRLPNVKM